MVQLFKKLNIHYAWAVLIGCFLLSMGSIGILINSVSLFIKPVSDNMGFSRGSFSLYYTFSTVVTTILAPLIGILIKKYGSKKLLIICTLGSALMVFCYSMCTKIYHFYIFGCIQGIFTGGVTTLAISTIIYRWFKSKRGIASGIALAGSGIASMILNPLVTNIIENIRWQAAYRFLAVLLLAINFIAIFVFIVDEPSQIGLKPYETEEKNISNKPKVESICQSDALKMPEFWILCVAVGISGIVAMGIQQHITAYISDIGYPTSFAASVLSFVMLILTVYKLLIGKIIDRYDIKVSCILICSLLCISSFLLLFAKEQFIPYIFATIFGGGYTIISILPTNLTTSLLGTEDYSANYGVVTVFLCFGMATGSPISAFIYDTCGSYIPAWILYGILSAAILIMYLIVIKRFRKRTEINIGG